VHKPKEQGVNILAAALVCGILGALAVFQALLAVGAPLGRFAWGGQHQVLPTALRVASAVSVAVYALLATIVLARAHLVVTAVPAAVVRTAAWVIVGHSFIGIGMELAFRSKSEMPS
jgi:predicted permease